MVLFIAGAGGGGYNRPSTPNRHTYGSSDQSDGCGPVLLSTSAQCSLNICQN